MNSDVNYSMPGVAICEANRKKKYSTSASKNALPKTERKCIVIIIVTIL
jgi:hypothetical protein